MNDGESVRPEPVIHGEVLETDEAYLRAVYDNSGIKDKLARYVDTHSSEDNDAAEAGLARFCNVIAATALKDSEVDVNVVRSAFELVTAGMNEVADRKYGNPRQGTIQRLLVRAGVVAPGTSGYVRYLDERYWSDQFMDQYENGGLPMAPRQEHETDQEYLARYTYTSMHGLLFAPFTLSC
jgi:hypothetical protein